MKKFFGNIVNEVFIKLFYYKPYRKQATITPCGARTVIPDDWERPPSIKWSHVKEEE
jgi:hypothetical protein